MVSGILFDIDGTLVLSNEAHARSWIEAFAARGYDVPFARALRLIGMGGDKLISTLRPELDDENGDGKQVKKLRTEIFLQKYAPGLKPAPGARELVQVLQEQGCRTIAASSAKRDELNILLKAAHVDDLLTEATTSDDADRSKPEPDIVQVALQKISRAPDETLMIGDTPYDIEAANKAGVPCIAVRCGGWSDDDLQGAAAIYDDPRDILDHLASVVRIHS